MVVMNRMKMVIVMVMMVVMNRMMMMMEECIHASHESDERVCISIDG